jgi:two-component system, OmpR family, sensor kinase
MAAATEATVATAVRASRPRRTALATRLLATCALLVVATLLVVGGLTSLLAREHLESELDRHLAAVAESFRRGPAHAADAASIERSARRWLAAQPLAEGEMAAIRTRDGTVLTSAGGGDLYHAGGTTRLLESTHAGWYQLRGDDGPVRALVLPIDAGGRHAGTLVLMAYEENVDRTLSTLLSGIGVAGGVGLLFALLLGALLIRRALLPLRRMTREVEAIEGAQDLSIRLGVPGGRDEVGRLATQFDRLLGRLDEAFRSQRRFLADASHELRTPLTVARGQLELLAEELERPDNRRSLAIATGEMDRMARMVEDLLLLARLDEGMRLVAEPVEVELVLREALLRALLAGRRPATVDVAPGLCALADGERLLQVLTNIVRNAVEHSDSDAELTLRARPAGGEVEISVADTGPGIPPGELAHVFERMFRGGGARHAAPSGAGLGLAIAASLTEAMGGRIAVDSTVGVGTTFTVTLPGTKPVRTGRFARLRRLPVLRS